MGRVHSFPEKDTGELRTPGNLQLLPEYPQHRCGAKKAFCLPGTWTELTPFKSFGALFNSKLKKKKLVVKNIFFFLLFLRLSGPHLCSGTAQVQRILPGAREKSTSPTPCFFPFPPFHPLPLASFPRIRPGLPCVFKFGRGRGV